MSSECIEGKKISVNNAVMQLMLQVGVGWVVLFVAFVLWQIVHVANSWNSSTTIFTASLLHCAEAGAGLLWLSCRMSSSWPMGTCCLALPALAQVLHQGHGRQR